ncbi:MAG: hypothetical protein A2Y98_01350 [Candidatus Portnoybacteria bacterium RBG_19FT_COMBO_36_7]|uniref:Uncharacterized protein n=1 Tax=Candidatus Portnoybacteria bacterium RBG_19FT_COMBO_36_7 TaxID=1801992 RepID=A0A1G2F6E8_9BACT|nr:MAG: hypothetical protein A2Y98_01350 [Candidatus Portnoybacteria bacterium RBG_19FT_COMBO_36_7]
MPDDFLQKVNLLPQAVKDVIFSNLPASENYKAATSYGINDARLNIIAKIIGLVFVKDVPLEKLPDAFQKNLQVEESIATGLALSITKSVFLPLKDFFTDVESLTIAWSPKAAPPTFPPQSLGIETEEKPTQADAQGQAQVTAGPETEYHRTIASALAKNEDALSKQIITTNPIKFADSEMLKFPSVKNWLADYLKYRSNFPDQEYSLIRAKYINDTPNTKGLSEKERLILAQILRSHDEFTALPFSQQTGLLLIDKLELPINAPPKQPPAAPAPQPATQAPPRIPVQQSAAPAPIIPTYPATPAPPSALPASQPPKPAAAQTAPPSQPQKQDTYREQVSSQDMAGPQPAPKPVPKLNGNVINLKDISSWQQ